MSFPDGRRIDQYDASTTDLVLGELADVIRASGFTGEHLVVIGGLVPTLLVPELAPDAEPHIGTTDLDLCVSVALVEGDTAEYERLESAIVGIGFEQSEQSFRWVRKDGLRMTLEFFCPASAERPPGRAYRPPAAKNATAKHNFGGKLSALSLSAGQILVDDVEVIERAVELPNGKGRLRISLRVTGPLAFLLAKKDALVGRDKPKDAYDIVWLIENWPGGPRGAASAVVSRSAFTAETRSALLGLRELFADVESVGAASFASFFANAERDLLHRRRAVGAVEEFLSAVESHDESHE